MYKVARIVRFEDDDARRRWTDAQGPAAARAPGVERYVQSLVVSALGPVGVSDEQAHFDGYSCAEYRDRAAFEASLAAAWPAEPSPAGWSATVDPHTIVDGPRAPYKTVWIMRFLPEVRASPELTREAHESWIAIHGREFGVRVPGISRYVQNHVVAAVDAEGENPALPLELDGFSECWFEDEAAFERTMASDEWLAMNEDAFRLFDVAAAVPHMSAVLDERVLAAQ